MRVLIVDDEAPARAKLARWLAKESDVEVVGEARDGLEAMQLITRERPQLVFLDIQMPELSGLEVAASLEQPAPVIVFVTAFDEHAVRAFDLNAVDYLLKPYDEERFQRCLRRARQRLSGIPRKEGIERALHALAPLARLLVKEGDKAHVLPASDLIWIEAADNYVQLHTGNRTWLMRKTLHALAEQLSPQDFMRVHKSAIVNIHHVRELVPLFKGDGELRLSNGATVAYSRRYREELRRRLGGA